MPIVLVENDETASGAAWDNQTWERYQFPNTYRGLITPGTRFIYYRGVRRRDARRGAAEYFGRGVIGAVTQDPGTREAPPKDRKWYCAIRNGVRFDRPVPIRVNDVPFENITRNRLANVRRIDENTYLRILDAAGQLTPEEAGGGRNDALPPLPLQDEVAIARHVSGLLASPRRNRVEGAEPPADGARRSRQARITGRRAEAIALRWIRDTYPDAVNIRWVADDGETPGWDIEFEREGHLHAVEVKGTAASKFVSFELTANERRASEQLGRRYLLALVADCHSLAPKIEIVDNIASLIEERQLRCTPTVWRITRQR